MTFVLELGWAKDRRCDFDYRAAPQRIGQKLMAVAEAEVDDRGGSPAHGEAQLGRYSALPGGRLCHGLAATCCYSPGPSRQSALVDSFRVS